VTLPAPGISPHTTQQRGQGLIELKGILPVVPDGDIELRHGYTLRAVNEMAEGAVMRGAWYRSLSISERLDTAYGAIIEHLYASDEPPDSNDRFRAAWNAMRRRVEDEWHTHGTSRTSSVYDGAETMPSYCRYWSSHAQNTASPEIRVIERVALWQIWRELTPGQQRVLTALAEHDDHRLAATALGYQRGTYSQTLSDARRAFLRLWHQGETPSKPWGNDRRRNPDLKARSLTRAVTRRKAQADERIPIR
jgi:hypothetical protein